MRVPLPVYSANCRSVAELSKLKVTKMESYDVIANQPVVIDNVSIVLLHTNYLVSTQLYYK